MTQTILLTGAAGNLGNQLRPYLCARYEKVILSDCLEITVLAENEQFRGGFLDNAVAMKAACTGVDAIVHMGGKRDEGQWDTVNTSNIQGFITLMEAAHSAGVKRMVFASSNHSIGMYGRQHRIGTGDKVRPDSRYGLSKAFGEALCALYADKHGMRCLSIRIGNVNSAPLDRRGLSVWLHFEDLCQLVSIGLEHPDLHNEIVFGCSDNSLGFWDNEAACQLGYRPQHKSDDHRERALAQQADLADDLIGNQLQGGGFGSAEFNGDIDRTLRS